MTSSAFFVGCKDLCIYYYLEFAYGVCQQCLREERFPSSFLSYITPPPPTPTPTMQFGCQG